VAPGEGLVAPLGATGPRLRKTALTCVILYNCELMLVMQAMRTVGGTLPLTLRGGVDDVDDDAEASRLYQWTQNLSVDDCPASPRVFSH